MAVKSIKQNYTFADVIASMNIAYKGWSRFCHPRGLSVEAMKRNLENLQPAILRVDGSKLVEAQR